RATFLALTCLLALISLALAQPTSSRAPSTAARFTTADVFIDPHGAPLAAYQVEILGDPSRVTLVGIEGGEHAAFKIPPYYDPKAMSGNRVILAALNAGTDLPRGKTRVARLHLRILGTDTPAITSKLIVAASPNEQAIKADVNISAEGASQ